MNTGHSSATLPVHRAHSPLDALLSSMQPVAFLLNFHLDSPQPQQGLAVITALATGQRSTANINDTLLLQLEI